MVVRVLHGKPDLATAMHADVVCVCPTSAVCLADWCFRRCLYVSPRMRADSLRVRAQASWVVKYAFLRAAPHPLPADEAALLGELAPPALADVQDVVLAL